MRRLALSLAAACSIGLLSACTGQGGYGFTTAGNGSTNIDRILFNNNSGGVDGVFFVAPGGALQVNATGTRGTINAVVPDSTFTWGVGYAPAGTQYQSNASGQTKPCGAPPAGGQPNPGAGPSNALRVIDTTTPGSGVPYDGRPTPTIYVTAVGGVPANAATGAPAIPAPAPPYCLTLVATHVGDGRVGSVTVVVSNSP